MSTIYDIAKRAGVSTTTVSRALNNHSDVKLSTRKRLQRLASEMGYQPNIKAKSLALKRSWSLGILLIDHADTGLKHTLFANIVEAISKAAAKRGYDITFLSRNLGESYVTYLQHANYRQFDGIIVANININDHQVKELFSHVEHIACIDQHTPNAICVNSQNKEGMKITLYHLFEKGHRNITYIHGQKDNYVTEERIKGFTESAKQLGILEQCTFIEGKYTSPTKAYEITKEIIKNGLPDAIVYSDDYSASGGLKCLHEHGIKVPEDVAIMGYDGVPLAKLLHPELTTIYQNTTKIGEVVTENLINSIEDNRSIGYIIELPVYLIKGKTT